MERTESAIVGHLDIIVTQNEDDFQDKKETWREIQIHGDPEGLRSLARLLLKLADTDQEQIHGLPIGAREHTSLRPKIDLSNSSEVVVVGRLDAKGTGRSYDRYIERNHDRD